MIAAFILTMIIKTGQGDITSFTVEYSSENTCNIAKDKNREALSGGNVILATCTRK